MGNNPSKGPVGDAPSGHVHHVHHAHHVPSERKVVRRTSLNAVPTSKATVADPSATRETAAGHSAAYQGSVQQRLQSRNPSDSSDSPTRNPSNSERPDGRRPEATQSKAIPSPDPSNPVQVPISRHAAGRDSVAPSGPPHNSYYNASTHLQRPPRMPLPIGNATTAPGSPISGPEDSHIQSLPADRLLDEQMSPEATDLSSTALDGDEPVDDFQPFVDGGVGKAVPTFIEWTGPGEKVYVTGTFVNWEKKFKLLRRYAAQSSISLQSVSCGEYVS